MSEVWKHKTGTKKLRAPALELSDAALVQPGRDIRNVAIIGFMGTGKSTVGQLAACLMNYALVDTDELVEARAGGPISEIFVQQGEAAFRAIEARVIEQLSLLSKTVISTGGGVGANAQHLASLKHHSYVVCLWAPPEVIYERVRHHGHRPLLQVDDPMGRIRMLLEQRAPIYRQADLLLNAVDRNPREIARQLVHHYRLATLAEERLPLSS